MTMEIIEHPTVVPGIIPQGSITLFVGRPDHGKSLVVQDLLTAHASGGLWLGEFPAGQGVSAYFDFEMPSNSFALRAKAQGKHRDLTDIPLFRFDNLNERLDRDAGTEELLTMIQKYHLTLVALDPLSDILGSADENDASAIRQVFSRLIAIARMTDVSFALADHRSKQGLLKASPLDEIRGSTVKVAKSDSIIAVTKSGEITKLEHLRYKCAKKHGPFSFKDAG